MTTSFTGAFRAMGTEIEITGVGVTRTEFDAGIDAARRLADTWERTYSRFRADSELSRLNAASGEVVKVSDGLLWVIERAIAAHRQTGGRFDPTILPALISTGYDRDFDLIRQRPVMEPVEFGGPAPGVDRIEFDSECSSVCLPAGVQLDLGGIAKGAFVDRLALHLLSWPGGCVNAGGDLRVWGVPPDGDCWIVGIEDPSNRGRDLAAVSLLDGRAFAVATSAINRRRWEAGGRDMHHLIDPGTGAPAAGDVISCTAFAASAVDAEIATKAIFVSSARHERPELAGAAAAATVDRHGRLTVLEGAAPDAIALVPAPRSD